MEDRLHALRRRVRLRRGAELELTLELQQFRRDLLDRVRPLFGLRDTMRNHTDQPFGRFELAMEEGRRALAFQQLRHAVDHLTTAASVLSSIEHRSGLLTMIEQSRKVHRNTETALAEDDVDLRDLPSFREAETLLAAADHDVAAGRTLPAERLIALHRNLVTRWSAAPTHAGRQALRTVVRLASPVAVPRTLPAAIAAALARLEAKGLGGLAGALALDVLARRDSWRIGRGGLLNDAGRRLCATAVWATAHIDQATANGGPRT